MMSMDLRPSTCYIPVFSNYLRMKMLIETCKYVANNQINDVILYIIKDK